MWPQNVTTGSAGISMQIAHVNVDGLLPSLPLAPAPVDVDGGEDEDDEDEDIMV